MGAALTAPIASYSQMSRSVGAALDPNVTTSSAMTDGPRDALVSIEKRLQSMTLTYTQGRHSCCY